MKVRARIDIAASPDVVFAHFDAEARPASSEYVVYDAPTRTVSRSTQSGLELTSTREFQPVPSGTRVTATVEWNVAMRYVGPIISLPIRTPLRRALRDTLTAAKRALERGS